MLDVIENIGERSAAELYSVAQVSTRNPDLVRALISGVDHPEEMTRRNSALALLNVAENQPEILYPYWNHFAALLQSLDSGKRAFSLQIIAALTIVDDQYRFEEIFHRYFRLLDDPDVTIACYTAWCAGEIARHTPHLELQITRRLLTIDQTHHSKPHKELIKAEIIKSFRRYYLHAHNPDILLDFAQHQLKANNPNTRIVANQFLKEFNPI